MDWAYGITTVPDRFATTLPHTLKSLADSGFDQPRLFIDACDVETADIWRGRYPITLRRERIRTFGNWVLALWELYLRNPHADRYAIFQDDLVCSKNLRDYLESCKYPDKGYLNLYTFPENEKRFKGWYLSNQKGLGAVALVFNRDAVCTILQSKHMVERPQDKQRGHKSIDGGIVTGFSKAGWREYVHNPSLVQHIGTTSSMGNKKQPTAPTFRGEDFDLMSLVSTPSPQPTKRRRQRIGLVGYNCATGLGELNRQIAEYADVDLWLVKPHSTYKTLPLHDKVDSIVCPLGNEHKLEKFAKSIDVCVFCEVPVYSNLFKILDRHRVRKVCIPMHEWMPPGAKGWPQEVDLFLCPTKYSYDQFAHVVPSTYFAWPVDTNRFKFQQRDRCESFLFVNGRGGWNGRKGAAIVNELKQLHPDLPIKVYSQSKQDWHPGIEFLSHKPNNSDLYSQGDVLLFPHHVDGLGLESMEAMACGMPVISTNGRPWNEIPALARIRATSHKRKVRRPVDWYIPDVQHLAELCHTNYRQDISAHSRAAREWAESMSWDSHVEDFNFLVREGVGHPK